MKARAECGAIDWSADTQRSSSRYDINRNALSQFLEVERRANMEDSKLRVIALSFLEAVIKPTSEHPGSSSNNSPNS